MDRNVNAVQTLAVAPDEADLRLDRWFRRRFPSLKHGHLERLLRTGQVRVDGRRVKAGYRLSPGEAVRVPPAVPSAEPDARDAQPMVDDRDRDWVQSLVLHRDEDLIALDKPPGLAVQGGTGTRRHLDALLDGLRFGRAERPRLVHRLDKDTSGVLLLARSPTAAARLAEAFRDKAARKLYWALVVGVPEPPEDVIESTLAKTGGMGRERMRVAEDGRAAATRYRVKAAADGDFAWLEMMPITGRTHQLRVHAAQVGTPIVGDRKYGGPRAAPSRPGIARKLHLHAREIAVPHPAGGRFRIAAPLPPHMRESWRILGFGT
jgi:23S rRNA pseudouridine955/2504/2580 synthase